jgi:response regulator RpfG family c-di-GMP phosphodiesterase
MNRKEELKFMLTTQPSNQPNITYPAYIAYPPSILMIENSGSPSKLKQKLEKNKYQVTWTNLCDDGRKLARWVDFDLILFNLSDCDTHFVEMCHRLLEDPQLTKTPVVLISPCPQLDLIRNTLRTAPVYYLPSDTMAATKLLRIVDQTRYIIDRYS